MEVVMAMVIILIPKRTVRLDVFLLGEVNNNYTVVV
jgi:hypothetical protein